LICQTKIQWQITSWCKEKRKNFRYQRGTHKPQIEEGQTTQWLKDKGQTTQWLKDKGQTTQWLKDKGQTTQWLKDKGQNGKQWSTKHSKLMIQQHEPN
jgi:hypothetical protein